MNPNSLPSASLVLLIAGYMFISVLPTRADSPLTSTEFHQHYSNRQEIVRAAEMQTLDAGGLKFLTSENNTPAEKLAFVNALGWKLERKEKSSRIYLKHLASRRGIDPDYFASELAKFSSEELTLYGYMYAMERYLNDDALGAIVPILRVAVNKHRESYVAQLALALVECQMLMHIDSDNWHRVWERYERFLNNKELKRPLNAKALAEISDYIKLYDKSK